MLHDNRYKDSSPADYERGRLASYEKRDFELDDIWHMVHAMQVYNIWRTSNSKLVAGRSIAMQTAGYNSSDVQRNYFKGIRHIIQDCTILKDNGYQHGANQHVQRQDNKQTLRYGMDKYGKEEMINIIVARFTLRLRRVTRSVAFGSAPRLTTGVFFAPLSRATLPSSMCMALLQNIKSTARAYFSPRWKRRLRPHRPKRGASGRVFPRQEFFQRAWKPIYCSELVLAYLNGTPV